MHFTPVPFFHWIKDSYKWTSDVHKKLNASLLDVLPNCCIFELCSKAFLAFNLYFCFVYSQFCCSKMLPDFTSEHKRLDLHDSCYTKNSQLQRNLGLWHKLIPYMQFIAVDDSRQSQMHPFWQEIKIVLNTRFSFYLSIFIKCMMLMLCRKSMAEPELGSKF